MASSEASCSAVQANKVKRRLREKSWPISRTTRWKGALRIRRSADLWYFRISRSATVETRNL